MSDTEGDHLFSRTQKIIILALVCVLALGLFLLRHRRNMTASDVTAISGDSAYALRIDINSATWREIALLPGVGEATARAVVADREAKGPFTSVDDLTRVAGIGEKTVAGIAPYAKVGPDE